MLNLYLAASPDCHSTDFRCDALQGLEAALTWLGEIVASFLNWFETAVLPTVLGHLVDGDIANLCNDSQHHPDCYAADYVTTLIPYMMMLGLVCWAWSVIKSLNDPSQSDIVELFYHVRRGLLMMAGITLAYPAVRFTYELCRVASDAMRQDILPGGFQVTQPLDPFSAPLGVALSYGAVGTIEIVFVTIWMAGITVGTLLGAVFGGFAIAVSPVSGVRGILGRWLQVMSGLMLLRLFFPPIAAVLIDLMRRFVTRPIADNGQIDWTQIPNWVFSIEHIALGIALLWVTGKVVSFLGQGIVAGAGTIPGMLSTPGTVYSGVASTTRLPLLVYKGARKMAESTAES